ncbi:MAG: hypothetical protein DRN04_10665 [Thermoprotei archaeon]|nr:MAG: hypothetical protein DRN04_10665 [Thermoprotei archaeon]
MRVYSRLTAITFTIRFLTAQFKEHAQKLVRRTYLIPPPSAVAGIFGAILGVPREKLYDFCREKCILAGAELLSFEGYFSQVSRIFKFDRDAMQLVKLLDSWYKIHTLSRGKRDEVFKAISELMTIYRSEVLYKPEYKFAIVSSDIGVIREGIRRIRDLNFEFEVFGGNDYHFVDFVGSVKEARLVDSSVGRGYCPQSKFKEVKASNFTITRYPERTRIDGRTPLVVPGYIGGNIDEWYIFVYGADIITVEPLKVVDDGESRIFVYPAHEYFVRWGT